MSERLILVGLWLEIPSLPHVSLRSFTGKSCVENPVTQGKGQKSQVLCVTLISVSQHCLGIPPSPLPLPLPLLLFLCAPPPCMCMCVCLSVYKCLWRPEQDARSPEAGVPGGCNLLETGANKFWSSVRLACTVDTSQL